MTRGEEHADLVLAPNDGLAFAVLVKYIRLVTEMEGVDFIGEGVWSEEERLVLSRAVAEASPSESQPPWSCSIEPRVQIEGVLLGPTICNFVPDGVDLPEDEVRRRAWLGYPHGPNATAPWLHDGEVPGIGIVRACQHCKRPVVGDPGPLNCYWCGESRPFP